MDSIEKRGVNKSYSNKDLKPDISNYNNYQSLQSNLPRYLSYINTIKKEASKAIIGQEEAVNSVLKAILSNGHVIVEGVPGIAKTLLIRTIAKISGCLHNRIQFTVDMLPADIIGFTMYTKEQGFNIIKGPVFSNFIIADEINRATPKTQSSLLEAMQERQVTIGKETYSLPSPFFVMATTNPIESTGVYPLPEAQVDRFLFKIEMNYPSTEEEIAILTNNISTMHFNDFNLKSVCTPEIILEMQQAVRHIYLNEEVEKYIVNIVAATRDPKKYDIKLGKYIEFGGSPRASISMFIGAKADALLNGSIYVTPQNVKNVALETLRHRIIQNYEGQAEGIKNDDIIKEILSKVPVP